MYGEFRKWKVCNTPDDEVNITITLETLIDTSEFNLSTVNVSNLLIFRKMEIEPLRISTELKDYAIKHKKNISTIRKVLCVMSNLDFNRLIHVWEEIVNLVFSFDDNEIIDIMLQVIEMWNDPRTIEFLGSFTVCTEWLDLYRISVRDDLIRKHR